MRNDLPGELVIDIAHPAALFAPTHADRADLADLLQGPASRMEASPHHALVPTVANIARALAWHMNHSGQLDAQVHAHHRLTCRWLRGWQSKSNLGDPAVG